MYGRLFSRTSDVFTNAQHDIQQEIHAGRLDGPIREDPEKAIKHMRDKYTLKLVKIDYEKKEPKNEVDNGVLEVSLDIPFTGDPRILEHHPSEFRNEVVSGSIYGNKICIEITGRIDEINLKRELERWQESFEFHLNSANKDAGQFNKSLQTIIKTEVDKRVKQLRMMDDQMASIGVPTKKP